MTKTPIRTVEAREANDIMARVATEIGTRGLTMRAAAETIGVGVATLEKHLAGEHVRSDSALKYRNWLEGRGTPQNVFVLAPRDAVVEVDAEVALPTAPARPHLVVDIFSGCGGLSLGFDLLGDGRHFRTILAVDNQAAPIAVLNHNAAAFGHGKIGPGRQMDLTEFTNEAEFLTFFLGHVAIVEGDRSIARRLDALADGAFPKFRAAIALADAAYVHDLNLVRASEEWRQACEHLDRSALGQTSVIGFHDQMRLPRTGTRPAILPAVLWGDPEATPAPSDLAVSEALVRRMEREWDAAVAGLSARQDASGRGQLTASARRVTAFMQLLESKAMHPVRAAWAQWRARRVDLRASLFEDPTFNTELRALYAATCPVSVLVGGPPCQGFSRIGRGKIRSLREAMVHVQGDAEAGDARNLLFRQYVMVLEALRPDVFLFENVQHFQSTVKADGVEFQATEVLAEAIANMSDGEVSYDVASRILDASRHGVPQTRQRYFMCGVRRDTSAATGQAEGVLRLRRMNEVTLGEALAGLPQPDFVGGDNIGREGGQGRVSVGDTGLASDGFAGWIRRAPPGATPPVEVDAHIARSARADDAAFFALMGPGKRWLDYRADEAPTMKAMRGLLDALSALPDCALADVRKAAAAAGHALPDDEELSELRGRMDGSLSLRLLLEQAGAKLNQPHHLLTDTYLAKREGHHGDWVARMDSGRPSKTMVSHMGKDTYGYVHPSAPRTISVREAARVQTFPDWFSFGDAALTDAFRMVGNAVPPLLSHGIAANVSLVLASRASVRPSQPQRRARI